MQMRDETPEESARQWFECDLADARQQPELPLSTVDSGDWEGDYRRDGGK
jgi:hypothetical protein